MVLFAFTTSREDRVRHAVYCPWRGLRAKEKDDYNANEIRRLQGLKCWRTTIVLIYTMWENGCNALLGAKINKESRFSLGNACERMNAYLILFARLREGYFRRPTTFRVLLSHTFKIQFLCSVRIIRNVSLEYWLLSRVIYSLDFLLILSIIRSVAMPCSSSSGCAERTKKVLENRMLYIQYSPLGFQNGKRKFFCDELQELQTNQLYAKIFDKMKIFAFSILLIIL